MKIDKEIMKKIDQPGLQELISIFEKYGFELRIAGGPVRDILIGDMPQDLDFATTAKPDDMKSIFNKENVRMINTKGETHGTITARIADSNFECTTLRIDTTTDGRHAEVEFITDWKLDAQRRDLTINAMFLGFDGTVYDYCNGIEHLQQRLVTFVGNPSERIQEDYLRILRYFRFFGRINESEFHDEMVIKSIKENVGGLKGISGERIFVELKKIIVGRKGDKVLSKMKECGIFPYIGLDNSFDMDNFCAIYNSCNINCVRAVTMLTAGFSSNRDAIDFIDRIKCSNKDKNTIHFILEHRHMEFSVKQVTDLLIDMKYKENIQVEKIYQLFGELSSYNGKSEEFHQLKIPIFPVNGLHLIKVNKKFRKTEMAKLVDIWKDNDYTMPLNKLMEHISTHTD